MEHCTIYCKGQEKLALRVFFKLHQGIRKDVYLYVPYESKEENYRLGFKDKFEAFAD